MADGRSVMAAVTLFCFQWLLASASSLVAGLLAWLVLDAAARRWPALRTRRAVWLAAQAVIAAAALLPFLPHSAQIGATPSITLTADDAASLTALAPEAALPASTPATVLAMPDTEPPLPASATVAPQTGTPTTLMRALPFLAALWLFIYAAGLARSIVKLLQARRVWRSLLDSARRLSAQELHAHGAFTTSQLQEITRHKLTVLRTDAAISPMLIGVRRPRLLLPSHLDALTREQQQMIVAHELHHWRARDPLCLAIAACLQLIFWFNPALRWMSTQMAWALELNCDQHVLAGRPQQQRKQYAAALLQQWTTAAPAGAVAFGGTTIAARLRYMQLDSLPTLNATIAWMIAAALAAVLALTAMLQPALAFTAPSPMNPDAAPPAAAVAAPPEHWRAPLDKVRVTSFFGVIRSVLPTPHKGIDFAAVKGTPVHATAAGTVIAAGPIAENGGRYGNTVIIDHGGEQSLYAHLDSIAVVPGQRLTAGQRIGTVGASGFATGPHLHLEMRRDGKIVDPASRFANLDTNATAHALNVRRQQTPKG
ncbi:M56 family metallopeptidase [Duganella sp. PWIR1]